MIDVERLGRYSNAPPWNAATALSRSEYAVMTITGSCGQRSFTFASSDSPDSPGMRTSDTSTCGCESASACSTS